MTDLPLTVAGKTFRSRLIVGTGKYPSNLVMVQAHEASEAEMVTVAVRRVNVSDRSKESLLWMSPSETRKSVAYVGSKLKE